MKKILILFSLIIISLTTNAQNPIKVDTIITIDNISKDDMFVKASTWIAQKYNSAQDVIQYSDKEAGVIICKGVFHHEFGSRGLYSQFYGYIDYTLSIKFKDEKFRITIDNFTHRSDDPNNPFFSNSFGTVTDSPESGGKWKKKKSFHKYWADLGVKCVEYGENIIQGLNEAITRNSDSEW